MFKPGESGNRAGRPRLRDLTLGDLLRRKVDSPRVKSAVAAELIKIATKGETEGARLKALGMILAELGGKPAPRVAAKSDGKVTVVFDEPNDTITEAA